MIQSVKNVKNHNDLLENTVDNILILCYNDLAVSIAWQYLHDEEENPSLTHSINNVYRDRVKAYGILSNEKIICD
jgi:peroxiredoxin